MLIFYKLNILNHYMEEILYTNDQGIGQLSVGLLLKKKNVFLRQKLPF